MLSYLLSYLLSETGVFLNDTPLRQYSAIVQRKWEFWRIIVAEIGYDKPVDTVSFD